MDTPAAPRPGRRAPRDLPRGAPILLMGGSFDPPTRAHARIALGALAACAPGTWLVLVPAARSPHKPEPPIASDAERVAMLDLAFDDVPRSCLWLDEIERATGGGASYWIDTLRAARPLTTGAIAFLIGADQAIEFDRWYEPGAILEIAAVLIAPRGEVRTPDQLATAIAARHAGGLHAGREARWWGERLLALPVDDGSSTRARALLASGASAEALAGALDPRVAAMARPIYSRARAARDPHA